MNYHVTIRPVKLGDEKTLAYIQTESWKTAFSHILSKDDLDKYTNLAKAEEMYTMLLTQNYRKGFILFLDDNPHCIAYWDKSRDETMAEYAELICIHSLATHWGKGYGSKMMDFLLTQMREEGFKQVLLWVFEDNHRARKFYENHGFVLSDKTKKFCDAIEVMYVKEL
ncbi:MAG TPA: N-acetyltransferase [Firmicutes bacterium]|nr:N-acetyltransferase [Bacillota bacterium]